MIEFEIKTNMIKMLPLALVIVIIVLEEMIRALNTMKKMLVRINRNQLILNRKIVEILEELEEIKQ